MTAIEADVVWEGRRRLGRADEAGVPLRLLGMKMVHSEIPAE